jgi:hypothetical protein
MRITDIDYQQHGLPLSDQYPSAKGSEFSLKVSNLTTVQLVRLVELVQLVGLNRTN